MRIVPGLTETVTADVIYAGDENYNSASTTVEIVVNPAPEPGKDNLTISASAEPIIVGDNADNVTAVVNYAGDDNYNSAFTMVNITVNPNAINIDAPDVVKYYGGSERFVVVVTDSRGTPLSNKNVTISINGRSYSRTTDENGTASLGLNLNSGAYNVTSSVDNQTVSSVVTVLSTVNGTDVVKMYRNEH